MKRIETQDKAKPIIIDTYELPNMSEVVIRTAPGELISINKKDLPALIAELQNIAKEA